MQMAWRAVLPSLFVAGTALAQVTPEERVQRQLLVLLREGGMQLPSGIYRATLASLTGRSVDAGFANALRTLGVKDIERVVRRDR